MAHSRKIFFLPLIVIFIFRGDSWNTNKPAPSAGNHEEPCEHFFFQRTYPFTSFDYDGYAEALKGISQIKKSGKTSSFNLNLPWELQGPANIGGRINTLAVHPANNNIIYAGCAGGGIFKTTDGGSSWVPVFDDNSFLAIGCIAIDPVDPNIIYAGTGDVNIPGNAYIGDGIYKSADGGTSWTYIGLSAQKIISKICINPDNTNIIYAATMGNPFEKNSDRGLYKTTDGGSTWSQILYISNDAGIIDLVMDTANPQVLYAAGWNRHRTTQVSIAYGPASKIYKTTDGGATWNVLTIGLPQNSMSRIGLGISRSMPNVLYAVYTDTTYNFGGLYKSVDNGNTWSLKAAAGFDTSNYGGFGWYFGKIAVNPWDPLNIFILGVDLYQSLDGGNIFTLAGPEWWTYDFHADKHHLVFVNSSTVLCSTDGGIYKSTDGGFIWTDIENIPATQFYRVTSHPTQSGMYYGGCQDNGTTGGNSTMLDSWTRIFGGDGFTILFNPSDPNIMYCEAQYGYIVYSDDGGYSFYDATSGIDPVDRRNWDMPYIMSSQNPDLLYTGTYMIYRNDFGIYGTWYPISPDLTDGIIFEERFHTISTIAESPVNINHLYAGTSDGNVWRSMDQGSTWQNVSSGIPDRYVTCVKASSNTSGMAYVSVSGYRMNDNTPHIFKTLNNGTSWAAIAGDLPQIAINDILPVPGTDSSLLVATDGGVFVTLNGGINWYLLGEMPVVPVFDIELEPQLNQVIAGTFARSIMTYPLDSVLIVGNPARTSPSFTVFPNPAHDFIYCDFGKQPSKSAVIEIKSIDGRTIADRRISYGQQTSFGQPLNFEKAGTSILRIPLHNVTQGIYQISLIADGRRTTRKIVKN